MAAEIAALQAEAEELAAAGSRAGSDEEAEGSKIKTDVNNAEESTAATAPGAGVDAGTGNNNNGTKSRKI